MQNSAFGPTLIHILDKVTSLVILNLLTLLCSIPVITIGASSVALYYSVNKVQQDEGNYCRAFFYSFKLNFLQATLIWLIMLAIGAALVFSFLFCNNTDGNPIFLFISVISLIVWCALTSWLSPLLSRYSFQTKDALRNSFLCTVAYWPISLLMIVTNFLPAVILLFFPDSFIRFGFIWLLFWFATAVYCNLQLIKKIYETLDTLTTQNKCQC